MKSGKAAKAGICYIVGAGSFSGPAFQPEKGDFVIAADAGLLRLEDVCVAPDLVVGDFDSLGGTPEGKNVVRHPAEKDDTDMLLAVKTGLELGYGTFVLYGGLGGRLDHTLANIQTLAYISKRGARGYLAGEGDVVTCVTDGGLRIAGRTGAVSVFCCGDSASGVNLGGFKYPLENAVLTCDFPVGVSNAFEGPVSSVYAARGTLTAMWREERFTLSGLEVF